jgi:hypothetical protein
VYVCLPDRGTWGIGRAVAGGLEAVEKAGQREARGMTCAPFSGLEAPSGPTACPLDHRIPPTRAGTHRGEL